MINNCKVSDSVIYDAIVNSRKAGWTTEDWSKFANNKEFMQEILRVMNNQAEIVSLEQVQS